MSLARRGIGISVYGGHGRTWISNTRLSTLAHMPQYQNRVHHEVGFSLTGLFYLFRLDVTRRPDTSGYFIGISPGLME